MLKTEADRIRQLESQAKLALHENNDPKNHKLLMTKKCGVLMALPEQAQPLVTALEPWLAASVTEELSSMATRAAQAVELDSVFYMAALLYPEDYQEGAPNSLEEWIDSLA
ncbi:MAG: hypothetical protein D6E12_08150 [Desulfovibrio sp.]|nr:MAG: hypothetical protein D6E12_08150 [Desulfovibrio sp.]